MSADGQRLLKEHLRRRAGTYWGAARDVSDVRLLRTMDRPAARLFWYEVQDGVARREIVAKVHTGAGHGHSEAVRALRPAEGYMPDRYAREVAALTALNRHFSLIADARYGTIPILDAIPEVQAIITERIVGTPMTRLFLRASILHPRTSRVLWEAITHAGAWLREWHSVQLPNLVTRRSSRAEFLDLVGRHCEFVGRASGDAHALDDLRSVTAQAADRHFPADLPLAVGHGDFAMRNIIVQRSGEVIVFDTLGVWRAPIFEDLATFVLGARLFRPQAYLSGLLFPEADLDRVEQRLLRGYAGGVGDVGTAQIDLYSVLLLLDKWASVLAPLGNRSRGRIRTRLLTRWYAGEAKRLVRRIAANLSRNSR